MWGVGGASLLAYIRCMAAAGASMVPTVSRLQGLHPGASSVHVRMPLTSGLWWPSESLWGLGPDRSGSLKEPPYRDAEVLLARLAGDVWSLWMIGHWLSLQPRHSGVSPGR
jgi:hypothetical protein